MPYSADTSHHDPVYQAIKSGCINCYEISQKTGIAPRKIAGAVAALKRDGKIVQTGTMRNPLAPTQNRVRTWAVARSESVIDRYLRGGAVSREALAKAVAEGWKAREQGLTRKACPYGYTDGRLRAGWLAGWHDRDFEMGNRWAPEYD